MDSPAPHSHRDDAASIPGPDAGSMLMPPGVVASSSTEPAAVATAPATLAPASPHRVVDVARELKPTAPPPHDSYQEVLRALRGRMGWAITLGLLGAAIGAAAAYVLKPPMYRATGLVRIAYTMPQVLEETDQNRPMAMFDPFLNSQTQVIRSRAVIEPALRSEPWQSSGAGAMSLSDFVDDLIVEHSNGTDQLRISFDSPDAKLAAAAVNAVVGSYANVYASRNDAIDQQRLALLQNQKQQLDGKLGTLNDQLKSATREEGWADLEGRYNNAAQRLNMLQSRLADVRLSLGTMPAGKEQNDATATPADATPKAPRDAELTPAKIALTDATMFKLLQDRAVLEEDISMTRQRYGYGDSHPEIALKKTQLEHLNQRIAQYAADYKSLQAEIKLQVAPLNAQVSAGVIDTATLQAQEKVISRMCEQASQDVTALGTRRQQVAQLTGEISKLREEIDTIERRVRTLQLESGLGSRFQVINAGEVPVRAFYNPRRKYVAAGALAGAAAPLGLLVLIGLLSGKYRFVHQTETDIARSAPLLGILPTLPEDLANLQLSADAAHCVHQIRVLLQMNRPHRPERNVYMVTSACSGEGKTSLTLALGLSFAAAGCKTLVIDCDLIGQGLTHGFGATGEPGLREAMAHETARGLVRKTPQGLRLLTAGKIDRFGGWTMCTSAACRIIAEVRRYYDVVLIDTGPILGSVEASVIAPEVDGVILTISRGQHRSFVDRAMRHLSSLRVKPAGFVFNRARSADFKRAAFSSSARDLVGGSDLLGTGADADRITGASEDVAAFGPLVRSVASFLNRPAAAINVG